MIREKAGDQPSVFRRDGAEHLDYFHFLPGEIDGGVGFFVLGQNIGDRGNGQFFRMAAGAGKILQHQGVKRDPVTAGEKKERIQIRSPLAGFVVGISLPGDVEHFAQRLLSQSMFLSEVTQVVGKCILDMQSPSSVIRW